MFIAVLDGLSRQQKGKLPTRTGAIGGIRFSNPREYLGEVRQVLSGRGYLPRKALRDIEIESHHDSKGIVLDTSRFTGHITACSLTQHGVIAPSSPDISHISLDDVEAMRWAQTGEGILLFMKHRGGCVELLAFNTTGRSLTRTLPREGPVAESQLLPIYIAVYGEWKGRVARMVERLEPYGYHAEAVRHHFNLTRDLGVDTYEAASIFLDALMVHYYKRPKPC